MKKMLCMILAVMMLFSCAGASGETVYTQVKIDRNAASGLMAAAGLNEEQIGMADIAFAVISALGINVTAVESGAQIDLDLNGRNAVSLGVAVTGENLVLASSLFPNYVVTVTGETLAQMMGSISAMAPGAGSEDFAAVSGRIGEYFARYIAECSASAVPGEPVQGEYEIDGTVFDVMTPVTIDLPRTKKAVEVLAEEMMQDEVVVGAISAYMQSSGGEYKEEDFKALIETFEDHIPDVASAEVYSMSNGSPMFYLTTEASYDGKEETSYRFDMFSHEDGSGYMGAWVYDYEMSIGIEYASDGMRFDFTMGDVYFGFDCTIESGDAMAFYGNVYVMDDTNPLTSILVSLGQGGARTLSMDMEGKSVLAVEDAMSDSNAANGLVGDVMANGIGDLMTIVVEEVPETQNLISMFSGVAE